jgi:hypothetical protein
MKRFTIFFLLLGFFCTASVSQFHDVTLKQIRCKTFPTGRIRYEYVFEANNDSGHRLNLIINVSLLDASKNVIDSRFLAFDNRPGTLSTGSIESDYGPSSSDKNRPVAAFYRLHIRNESHRRSYQKEGNLAVPLIRCKG